MAEEVTLIHDHAVFFDEVLNCIPASMYLQPTEEDNQRWMKAFKVDGVIPIIIEQKNRNAEKIKEMKENAQKKRKEKFNPTNDLTMVEQIAERKKRQEEEEQSEIAAVVPLAPAARIIFLIVFDLQLPNHSMNCVSVYMKRLSS